MYDAVRAFATVAAHQPASDGLSLALGIGANTAIFTLVDTVLLKTLPVRDPQRLFFVDNSCGTSGGSSGPPYPCFEQLRDHNRFPEGIAAFEERPVKVTIDGHAEQVRGQHVSGSHFDLLGVRAALGRVLTPADDSIFGRGGPDRPVAVISNGLRLEPTFDLRVLGFTAGVAALTALFFSIAPALHATRGDAAKPGPAPATSATRSRVRIGGGFVLIQMAFSVVLLCGAALFLRTLHNLNTYAVIRRTREIGIRIAIGAPQHSVIWTVVRDTLALGAIGGAAGAAASILASRLVSSQLFGVGPEDPVAIAARVLLLFAAAAAAASLPARRETRISPMLALRCE